MKTRFSDRTFYLSQLFLYQDLSLYILVFINTYICISHWKIFLLLFYQGYDFVCCGKGSTYTKLTTAKPIPKAYHCKRGVRIRSYSGLYSPVFRLNTEQYGVSVCIQSEIGKMRTRITPNTDIFHAVYTVWPVIVSVSNYSRVVVTTITNM